MLARRIIESITWDLCERTNKGLPKSIDGVLGWASIPAVKTATLGSSRKQPRGPCCASGLRGSPEIPQTGRESFAPSSAAVVHQRTKALRMRCVCLWPGSRALDRVLASLAAAVPSLIAFVATARVVIARFIGSLNSMDWMSESARANAIQSKRNRGKGRWEPCPPTLCDRSSCAYTTYVRFGLWMGAIFG